MVGLKATPIAQLQDAKRPMPHADHWATGSDFAALSLRHSSANVGPSSGCFAGNYPPGHAWTRHIALSCRKHIPGLLQSQAVFMMDVLCKRTRTGKRRCKQSGHREQTHCVPPL